MRSVVVSVDYADFLAVTLPRNAPHFTSTLVVTTPADTATQSVVNSVVNAECFKTDAFYRGEGAIFRKWLALGEALEYMQADPYQYDDWLCVWDADVVMPEFMDAWGIGDAKDRERDQDSLYVPRRRMLRDPAAFTDSLDWQSLSLHPEREFPGYFQCFSAQAKSLEGVAPVDWYDGSWSHCGGADSFFALRFPESHRRRPPFEVLHLGEDGVNWCGRSQPYLDGTTHPDAEARRAQLDEMIRERHSKRGPGKYDHEKVRW